MDNDCTVTGNIVLPDADLPTMAAEVIVRLEDVSNADARSTTIAEHKLRDVPLHRGSLIPFSLEVAPEQLDKRNFYSS